MAQNDTPGELSPAQKRTIAALLTSRDVRAAAEAAKVSERSLWRWLKDPVFKAALLAAEGEAIDQAARRLLTLQEPAISVIAMTMADKNNPAAVRLRAAQTVLDYLLKVRELRNTEARLADLEAAVYGNTPKAD